jgi:ethanolamine utilization protein
MRIDEVSEKSGIGRTSNVNLCIMQKEQIKTIVREVLKEKGLLDNPANKPDPKPVKRDRTAPAVLNVFHAGVRKLEQALEQVRRIEEAAGKSSVYTVESARSWVCGADVRQEAGVFCILDTVKPDGLEKVLQKADVLVLPTFCLKTGAKLASLICDDQESGIVFTALLQGKKILAVRDGFLICDLLVNDKLRQEIDRILRKLEDFGMVFCDTDQLHATFLKMTASDKDPKNNARTPAAASGEKTAESKKLVTAKDINTAVDNGLKTLTLAPGGILTPLAKDLAREYGVKLITPSN